MFYEVSKSVIVRIVAPDTLFGQERTGQRINLFSQEDSLDDIYLSSFIRRRP